MTGAAAAYEPPEESADGRMRSVKSANTIRSSLRLPAFLCNYDKPTRICCAAEGGDWPIQNGRLIVPIRYIAFAEANEVFRVKRNERDIVAKLTQRSFFVMSGGSKLSDKHTSCDDARQEVGKRGRI
jgi:hypothetical protein